MHNGNPFRLDRRAFLGASLGGLAAGAGALSALGPASRLLAGDQPAVIADGAASVRPDTLFLTWQRDPTTTMTVQWIAKEEQFTSAAISYSAFGKNNWRRLTPRKRPYPLSDLHAFRAELTQLTPGTEYEFRIGDLSSVYRFRSMPAKATDAFQFISGGDCGVNPHAVANNLMAARQDPMFAVVGGDLGYDDGERTDISLQFVRNYSQQMIDTQGRLIPMVVCIGNHEVKGGYRQPRERGPFFFALHDGLFSEQSYATLDFGDYLSLVLLDSGHVSTIGGEQTSWLDKALAERSTRPHVFAVNHVPAYPSFRPIKVSDEQDGSGAGNRKHWCPLFEKHKVDVVLEHHDHTFKRTHPLVGGLVDPRGVVYLGDGSWGRLRPPKPPHKRPYLAMTHEAYHVTLHRLEGARRFHLAIDEGGKIIDVYSTRAKNEHPV